LVSAERRQGCIGLPNGGNSDGGPFSVGGHDVALRLEIRHLVVGKGEGRNQEQCEDENL